MNRKKDKDPIPKEFANYEEAAEFWDTHDTSDYPDAFRSVKTTVKFKRRHYEIEVDEDIVKALQATAKQKGVTINRLASELLRRQLSTIR